MKMTELKEKASGVGVIPTKMKKIELIHAIQKAEGNNQCYGISYAYCGQMGCCFREDCSKVKL